MLYSIHKGECPCGSVVKGCGQFLSFIQFTAETSSRANKESIKIICVLHSVYYKVLDLSQDIPRKMNTQAKGISLLTLMVCVM